MWRPPYTFLLAFLVWGIQAAASPLAPVGIDSPRATLRTFLEEMDAYARAQDNDRVAATTALRRAMQTLDGDGLASVTREHELREAAVFLKEVLDRVWERNFTSVPGDREVAEDPPARWRVPQTEITISRITEGDRQGDFVFSRETVLRSQNFFLAVEHLPYLEGLKGAGFEEPWFTRRLPEWASDQFLTLTNWQWAGIFLSVLVGLAMKLLIQLAGKVLTRLMGRTSIETQPETVQTLASPVALLVATVIWFASIQMLRLHGIALTFLTTVLQVLLFVSVTWILYAMAGLLAQRVMIFAKREDTQLDEQLAKLITRSVKVVVLLMGLLLAAQNLGINVFSVLAGLGIGGLAVALAAQDSLSNFFGSLMIMLDRPFKVGHWVKVGDLEGTVEDIGFRSTRIRTFYDSVIVVPNTKVATTAIDNMGMRQYRRVRTIIGVTYNTPPDKIQAFLDGIREIIRTHPSTRKDLYHVYLNDFGSSSLDILLYFFVHVPDWGRELKERESVLMDIVRMAAELGVQFAFPTRTLHLKSVPEIQPAPLLAE